MNNETNIRVQLIHLASVQNQELKDLIHHLCIALLFSIFYKLLKMSNYLILDIKMFDLGIKLIEKVVVVVYVDESADKPPL